MLVFFCALATLQQPHALDSLSRSEYQAQSKGGASTWLASEERRRAVKERASEAAAAASVSVAVAALSAAQLTVG